MDGVTCDDEASIAKKRKPDNQGLGMTVLLRPRLDAFLWTVALCEKNRDPLDNK
jgi:hypothetical protein